LSGTFRFFLPTSVSLLRGPYFLSPDDLLCFPFNSLFGALRQNRVSNPFGERCVPAPPPPFHQRPLFVISQPTGDAPTSAPRLIQYSCHPPPSPFPLPSPLPKSGYWPLSPISPQRTILPFPAPAKTYPSSAPSFPHPLPPACSTFQIFNSRKLHPRSRSAEGEGQPPLQAPFDAGASTFFFMTANSVLSF